MNPIILSDNVKQGISDFIETTFQVTNPFFHGIIQKLLESDDDIFKDPFISIKLPFRICDNRSNHFTDILPDDFIPYRHQELAFDRLDSKDKTYSTLIATGTGSGKTECF